MGKGVLEWVNVLKCLVGLNGWVLIDKLSSCGFESRCSHWSAIKVEETACVFLLR